MSYGPPHCSLISAYLPLEKQAATVRSQPRCAGTFAEGHGPHSQDVRSETQCLVWEGGIADCFLACADGQQGTGVAGQTELGPEAWHCLLGWTVRPGLGRLVQAGVGTGLGVQAVMAVAAVAVAAAESQTEAVGVLMTAAGGAGVAAVERTLREESQVKQDGHPHLPWPLHTQIVSQAQGFLSFSVFLHMETGVASARAWKPEHLSLFAFDLFQVRTLTLLPWCFYTELNLGPNRTYHKQVSLLS